MPSLDPQEAAQIADSLTGLAAAVNSYLNANEVAEPEYSKLNSLQTALTQSAADWEQQAAQIDYDDATAAFEQLSKATSAANAVAAQLRQRVADISRVAAIVGNVADFAVALGTGSPAKILQAAGKVVAAAKP
jgi:hypothetical protein